MTEAPKFISVDSISFDTDNPRIKMALEKYGDELDGERIHFALKSAADGSRSRSSYSSLRDSIRARHGILVPIVVTDRDGRLTCIDGNTRLAIYKEFAREGLEGDWGRIKAIALSDVSARDIESVRITAHLVGAREWPAYEKARYLHYLRNKQYWDYGELIALCGGNKQDIERQIDAYHDMNAYYRDLVDDTAFHIDRYSGFVELQKPRIKDAILNAGLDLSDFGKWIRDGQIYRLEDVRKLPSVLSHPTAKDMFLSGGPRSIENASKWLEHERARTRGENPEKVTIATASIHQLATTLAARIRDLPFSQMRQLRQKQTEDAISEVGALEELAAQLQLLLEDVGE